jgi:hypothetical protein
MKKLTQSNAFAWGEALSVELKKTCEAKVREVQIELGAKEGELEKLAGDLAAEVAKAEIIERERSGG